MRRFLPFLLALIALSIFTGSTYAAPSANLWERWTQHDPASAKTIDHSAWTSLLNLYLLKHHTGVNHFRYEQVSQADQKKLNDYLIHLTKTKISQYNRNEQRAYWINLYNALTVNVVIKNLPVRSIKEISSGLFSSGPWKKKLLKIEGEELSLDDIEHRILRPIWKDPRLHYAVNCASVGCPNLQAKAFTAANSESLLDKGARDYINHPRGVKVDDEGRLRVSSIYVWFSEDFGGDEGILQHFRQYADPPLASSLQRDLTIDDDYYNWNLNGVGTLKAKPKTGREIGS